MTSTDPEPLWDRALDRSIVVGYSTLGFRLRRRRWPSDPGPDALRGRRALVTGAGSGIGEATALGLARLGATVHLLGRSSERVLPSIDRIRGQLTSEGHPPADRLLAEACDVSDLEDVRRFCRDLGARLDEDDAALDVLVHNAGTLRSARTTSAQRHELSVATHVLGPVLMTELLLPSLARSSTGARVVLVSSGGMYAQRLPVDDPEFQQGTYRGATAYARSKRMQVELTPVLAERLRAQHVAVYAMHPGWADTPGVATSLPLFRTLTRPLLRDSAEGADTIIWLASTEPPPASGTFWHDRRQRPIDYLDRTATSAQERARSWEWVGDALRLGTVPDSD